MSASPRPVRPVNPPIPLHDRALENITFIRDTMERAGTVTSVPGWGGVAMGATALAASWIASRQGSHAEWLAVWLAEAVLALGIGGVTMIRKAETSGTSLFTRAGRLFVRSFVPPMLAGVALTPVFYQAGLSARLPALWVLMYGAAVTAAGATSIRVVPVMGMSFMALGVAGFLLPSGWGDLLMAASFGALQIGFGLVIARKYGG